MTTSPSETTDTGAGSFADWVGEVASAVGSEDWSADHGTAKVMVAADAWHAALSTAKLELGLVFFSYLSAIDWANDVAVGDPPAEPVDERYEVLAGVADLAEGRIVHFSTTLPKDGASLPSITDVYAGANWHEREATEMFDIAFEGHPNPVKLYLPDAFEGHPLQKTYPLLSREVKPWPGTVDVEPMPEVADPEAPSTENPEA